LDTRTSSASSSAFCAVKVSPPPVTVTWTSAATMLPTTVLAPQWNVITPINRAE
jgi:hypothetical protein